MHRRILYLAWYTVSPFKQRLFKSRMNEMAPGSEKSLGHPIVTETGTKEGEAFLPVNPPSSVVTEEIQPRNLIMLLWLTRK